MAAASAPAAAAPAAAAPAAADAPSAAGAQADHNVRVLLAKAGAPAAAMASAALRPITNRVRLSSGVSKADVAPDPDAPVAPAPFSTTVEPAPLVPLMPLPPIAAH